MKWTKQEDDHLKQLIRQQGSQDWEILQQRLNFDGHAFLKRSVEECKARWFQVIKNQIRRDRWSEKQEKLLFILHSSLGSKWTEITKKFPGRDLNSVKNHFYMTVKKKLRRIYQMVYGGKRSTNQVKKIKPHILSTFFLGSQTKKIGKFTPYQLLELSDHAAQKKDFKQNYLACFRDLYEMIIAKRYQKIQRSLEYIEQKALNKEQKVKKSLGIQFQSLRRAKKSQISPQIKSKCESNMSEEFQRSTGHQKCLQIDAILEGCSFSNTPISVPSLEKPDESKDYLFDFISAEKQLQNPLSFNKSSTQKITTHSEQNVLHQKISFNQWFDDGPEINQWI